MRNLKEYPIKREEVETVLEEKILDEMRDDEELMVMGSIHTICLQQALAFIRRESEQFEKFLRNN